MPGKKNIITVYAEYAAFLLLRLIVRLLPLNACNGGCEPCSLYCLCPYSHQSLILLHKVQKTVIPAEAGIQEKLV